MKLLVIVDDHFSAIGLAASARKSEELIEVLAANDYYTPFMLLKAIEERKPTTVFFAWRGALRDILQCGWRPRRVFKKLNQVSIGVLIPDLMGLETGAISQETRIIDLVDFYMVTSKELYSLYSFRFPKKPPSGLYRDLPNLALIDSLKNENSSARKQRVIWVGNSKWGVHQGAVDHKGMNEVVIPLRDKLRQNIDFWLIDSTEKRLPHEMVLREIRDSKVLIQTSKTEGTGLPLLEAAGLGTITITTDVGVASDFLQGELQKLIVERSVEGFSVGIDYAFSNSTRLSKMLEERFKTYVDEVSRDFIPQLPNTKTKDLSLFSIQLGLIIRMKWFRRWLLARL